MTPLHVEWTCGEKEQAPTCKPLPLHDCQLMNKWSLCMVSVCTFTSCDWQYLERTAPQWQYLESTDVQILPLHIHTVRMTQHSQVGRARMFVPTVCLRMFSQCSKESSILLTWVVEICSIPWPDICIISLSLSPLFSATWISCISATWQALKFIWWEMRRPPSFQWIRWELGPN